MKIEIQTIDLSRQSTRSSSREFSYFSEKSSEDIHIVKLALNDENMRLLAQ